MNEAVFKTLKQKDYIVKSFLFKVATELKLSLNDLILLIYFLNQDIPTLDINKIENETYLSEDEILEAYTNLLNINLISVEVKEIDNKVSEIINLDNILKDVSSDLAKTIKKDKETNLFEKIEGEFGRTLSPMEYEIINSWLDDKIEEELIEEALKEAIFNGAKSLRYIEKILLHWKDLGYKSKSDIKRGLKKESDNTVVNLLDDYDWLADEE